MSQNEKMLQSVHPVVAAKVRKALARLEAKGWQPVIASAYRSIEEQAEKVRLGYSSVSFSYHNGRIKGRPAALACDIVDRRWAWTIPQSHAFWADLGKIAKEEGLDWGGDWKKRDVAHVEIRGYALSDIRAFVESDGKRGRFPALWVAPEKEKPKMSEGKDVGVRIDNQLIDGDLIDGQTWVNVEDVLDCVKRNGKLMVRLRDVMPLGTHYSWNERKTEVRVSAPGD